MPHLHLGHGEYDHSASAFIIRVTNSKPKLLLHLHKKFNILTQPGGHIEISETPWAAITHEIEEETGYNVNQLKLLQPHTPLSFGKLANSVLHPVPMIISSHSFDTQKEHFHTDWCYAFITSELPENKPHEGESEDLRWVTEEELEALTDEQIIPAIRQIGLVAFQQVLNKWDLVAFDAFSTDNPAFDK